MARNKDPAVLFYTSDFLVGCSELTMEERGQYITLLCLQHQKGHLSKKAMTLAVGAISPDVMAKFLKDENGHYYNNRMNEEAKAREKYLAAKRAAGSKGGIARANSIAKAEQIASNATSTAISNASSENVALENENKNENKNISNTLYKELSEVLSNTSNTTTTTTNCLFNTGEAHEMSVENYQQFKLDVENFFLKNHFISSPRAFIDYNESRGWLGSGGAPLWQEDRWKDYARLWEERRFDN